MSVRIERLAPADAADCEAVLRSLPEWFGLEEGIAGYRRDVEAMETHGIRDLGGALAGFLTLRSHFAQSAEIRVMAVRREHRRRGVGRALVEHAEGLLRERGVEYLQVKTLSPTRPDARYEETRAFYRSMGFRELEEFPTLWDPANPCLLFVKRL